MRSKQKETTTNSAVEMKTRWFQGHKPLSITSTLMYYPPYREKDNDDKEEEHSNKKQKTGNAAPSTGSKQASNTTQDVIDKLQRHTLTIEELRGERFPLLLADNDETEKKEMQSLSENFIEEKRGENSNNNVSPILQSIETVKHIIQKYHVNVTSSTSNYDDDEVGDDARRKYVSTAKMNNNNKTANSSSNNGRVFAIDCEMVRTSRGRELARVTMIQLVSVQKGGKLSYQAILDELVKPYSPVLDYLTKYSGITATMLEPVQTRIDQIQVFLADYLHENDILVGHSLENDLHAIRLVHTNIVDTSILFLGQNQRKFALKHLTSVLLKRTIQSGEGGHCSEVDAAASLELAIRRVQKGSSFRIHESNNNERNQIHLINCLKQQQENNVNVFVGPGKWLNQHIVAKGVNSGAAHALSCESVHDNTRKAMAVYLTNPNKKRRAKIMWGKLVATDHQDSFDSINSTIEQLYTSRLIGGSIVLIAFQVGFDAADRVYQERRVRKNPRATLPWTTNDEQRFQEAMDTARYGRVIWLSGVHRK